MQAFNGKKWEKFNSEKVATLTYARIQGKVALIAHFQNSSLMNEDKRCRPILFHTDGPNAGDQVSVINTSDNIILLGFILLVSFFFFNGSFAHLVARIEMGSCDLIVSYSMRDLISFIVSPLLLLSAGTVSNGYQHTIKTRKATKQ